MFVTMSKKKAEESPVDAEPPDNPVSWRPDDPRLRTALDKLSKINKRSRNMMITFLIEEACVKAGLWPPP